MLKTTLFFLAALLGLGALSTESKAQTYSFDVPEKLVNISFESRMDVEDIIGSTNKAKGAVTRQKDGRLTFRVQVPVASLRTGIAVRDEHLRSESWLDAKRHPHIQLKGDKARKLSGDTWRLTGTFTMRGVSRPLQVDVTVKQIPAAVARKAGLEAANWIRVRGTFTVKLSHHGVRIPSMAATKVNDRWTVRISLFAKETR